MNFSHFSLYYPALEPDFEYQNLCNRLKVTLIPYLHLPLESFQTPAFLIVSVKEPPLLLQKIRNDFPSLFILKKDAAEPHSIRDTLIFDYLPKKASEEFFYKILRNAQTIHSLQETLTAQSRQLDLAEGKIYELQRIAVSLSSEKEIDRLLKVILRFSIDVTQADAAALYLIDQEAKTGKKILRFMLNQNTSLNLQSVPFTMPLDQKSIAGYVAMSGKILNIPDSYQLTGKEKYTHSKKFDEDYHYRTRSILTLPMADHKNKVIGVIQLINKKNQPFLALKKDEDFMSNVVPFTSQDERFAYALASQAAVALENAQLYESIQRLFEGFIKASSKAIESRDPVTSGHSERVARYSLELAKAVSLSTQGAYTDTFFSEAQLKEIFYAGLLHDFGKVGVREEILNKQKKLSEDRLQLIQAKIDLAILCSKNSDMQGRLSQLRQSLNRLNEPLPPSQEDLQRLMEFSSYTYELEKGIRKPLFSAEDQEKLSIVKGNLTPKERREMESHVEHSFRFLHEIPWTEELSGIPDLAYGHHEKLSGSGYPRNLSRNEISLGQRILAIADIFDALTAEDRPYKKAIPPNKTFEILHQECAAGNLDPELLRIFEENSIHVKVQEWMKSISRK